MASYESLVDEKYNIMSMYHLILIFMSSYGKEILDCE